MLGLAGGSLLAQEIIPAEPPPPAQAGFLQKYWPFGSRASAPPAVMPAPSVPAAVETRIPPRPGAASAAAVAQSPDGPSWASLTPAQRAALEPLAREWGSLDAYRRQKWLEIAERMPRMAPDKQARMQARMTEWAHMTPQQRAQVRMQFQEARQVAPVNRKESWDAYLALPEEQRRQLAERAAMGTPSAPSKASADAERRRRGGDAAGRNGTQAKSNIVVAPDRVAAPRAVAPTVVQAQPGATTTLMSRRAAPPGHQQAGLPKIVATPDFVDRATLLPQRGAQGVAVRPVAASEPMPRR